MSRCNEWVAKALVYSGRPNPEWPVSADVAGELERGWAGLPPAGVRRFLPKLGYRGCSLIAPDGRRWTARSGVVVLERDGQFQYRADPDGRWERLLLGAAPSGTLPAGIDSVGSSGEK
jgi:hypothetical protein